MNNLLLLIIGLLICVPTYPAKKKVALSNSKIETFRVDDFEFTIMKNSFYPDGVILKKDLSRKAHVDIPDFIHYQGTKYTVEEIGSDAFGDNDKVVSITVPGSVYIIDLMAFYNLKQLKSITFSPTKIDQEVFLEKHQPENEVFSQYSPNLIISFGAFFNCESLESIDFTQRRVFIYADGNKAAAFYNCKSLKSIWFNEVGFSRDDKKIFKGCHVLKSFVIGNKNPSKYKNFFEPDAPFMTYVFPLISSMSDEEYTNYLHKDSVVAINNEPIDEQLEDPQIIYVEEGVNTGDNLFLTRDIMTIPMQRKDFNENVCALLKVMVPKKGLTFEGNVIGNVEYKNNGQYWVYVSPGTKKVRINVPGEKTKVLDLDDYKDFKAFEPKRIYEYSFEVTPTQTMNITYSPSNAMILIDGNLQDGQNGKLQVNLPLGDHSYMIVAKGYVTSEGIVKLTSKGESSIIVNLTPIEE